MPRAAGPGVCIGWIPYFLERADDVYEHHHAWTHNSFGDRLPSDLFREHVVPCFIDDAAGVRNRDRIGLDTITWECDYPHSDRTWPHSPETLWKSLERVADADIDAMTHGNVLRHFRHDPFRHVPRAQAKGVDEEAARRAMLERYARAQAARK